MRHLRAASASLVLALIGLAIGLPIAVDWGSQQPAFRPGSALAGAGSKVTVTEPVNLSGPLPLILERGTLTSIGQSGVSLTDTVSRLEVDSATFRIPVTIESSAALPLIVAGDGMAPLITQLVAMNFGQLAIRRSRVDFVAANGWTTSFTGVSLDVTASRKGAFQMKGSATFLGQAVKFELSGTLPPAEPKPVAGRRIAIPIKISLKSSFIDVDFDGRMVAGEGLKLSGDADFRARKLRGLARWFGLKVPIGTDLNDASIVGSLDWGDGILAFKKVVVVVDGNRGEGAILLRLGGDRPTLDGTLDFKTFNLGPQLAAQMSSSSTPQPGGKQQRESIASAFDADLRLSTAKVTIQGLETGRAAATITLRSGRMQAELAELEIEGGMAKGQAVLDMNAEIPRLAVRGKLTDVDPGRVFVDVMLRNPLTGRADIVLDGAGNGFALPDMIADFSGKAQIAILAGGRLGLDLKALAYSARNAKHVGWSAAGRGVTQFDRLEARLQFAKGAVTIEAAEAKGVGATVMSAGKIDLPGRLLDLTVQLMGAAPDAKTTPAEVLIFRGSWADPAISLQGRPFTSPAPTVKSNTVVVPIPAPSGPRQ